MAEVKWIKIVTDIFDDEKILLIESMPESDAIIVVWFKLLCLAGKNNNSGVFMLNDKIHYTDEMLATIFRKPLNTVRLALKTFEEFGMIEIINNVITIPNWNKHQSLDAYERKKERDRIYQREKRAKQKLLANKKSSDKSADESSDVVALDIERDKEEDKEKEIDINNISKDILCSTFVERVIESWNSLGLTSKLKTIKTGTKRYSMLKARVKQYSEDEIVQAINNIKESSFLMGRVKDFEITFDWFIRPNNFIKVLENNYKDKGDKNGFGKSNSRIEGEESGISGTTAPGWEGVDWSKF